MDKFLCVISLKTVLISSSFSCNLKLLEESVVHCTHLNTFESRDIKILKANDNRKPMINAIACIMIQM